MLTSKLPVFFCIVIPWIKTITLMEWEVSITPPEDWVKLMTADALLGPDSDTELMLGTKLRKNVTCANCHPVKYTTVVRGHCAVRIVNCEV